MLSLTFCRLFICLLLIVIVNCDYLTVKTRSGPVRGVVETAFLSNKTYISYRGIPYAEPPIGDLRFRAPVPVTRWRDTLQANNYRNACLVVAQSQLFPLNNPQSEDCLYLNIFTPVLTDRKNNAKKAVMFFIHGGGFTEGDGTDGFYGPDFMVDDNIILVTHDYRLGPWGFANFDERGYTGNMGFKDQQLALEWTKKNIKYFGGDPNSITIFGESAGGAAVHLQVLSNKSRRYMKRAIVMSGSAFAHFAFYQEKNHIQLIKDLFNLDQNSTSRDVLNFMLNAPTDLIIQTAPALTVTRGLAECYWAAVIEDKRKAEKPFLTRNPREIYKDTNIDVDVMFGFTSAEYLLLINPTNLYDWVEPMKSYSNIGFPFDGLTLSPESARYKAIQKQVKEFYFGTDDIQETPEYLNIYVQMNSDTNFVYPIYEAMRLQSADAKTFCYQNDIELSLNFLKIMNNYDELSGMVHFEDLLYLFRSNKYSQLYDQIVENQDDPTNEKTLEALTFVPKMFTDYAKTGSPGNFEDFKREAYNCIHITNDGLKAIVGPRKEAIAFWDDIYKRLQPWIVN